MKNTFPLAVYGLQDVFSGYIIYLKLWTSNSDPKLVGRWYLEHLYRTRGSKTLAIMMKHHMTNLYTKGMLIFNGVGGRGWWDLMGITYKYNDPPPDKKLFSWPHLVELWENYLCLFKAQM